jgi:hypothetical protein
MPGERETGGALCHSCGGQTMRSGWTNLVGFFLCHESRFDWTESNFAVASLS